MVVKKKGVEIDSKAGMIDSPELTRVREAIQTLNREEGDTVAATKKAPAKKAAKETEAPKSKKPAAEAEDDRVTLSAVCEKLGIKPAAARRKLRTSDIDRGDGRWAWKKGSKELAAVEAELKSLAE